MRGHCLSHSAPGSSENEEKCLVCARLGPGGPFPGFSQPRAPVSQHLPGTRVLAEGMARVVTLEVEKGNQFWVPSSLASLGALVLLRVAAGSLVWFWMRSWRGR